MVGTRQRTARATGIVHAPPADGGEAERGEVGLGLTDGKRIEITSGLDEGREVLKVVPGQTLPAMECDPVTGEGCRRGTPWTCSRRSCGSGARLVTITHDMGVAVRVCPIDAIRY